MKLVYHKELDGVRAIAAFMVIFFHFFYDLSNIPPVLTKIASFGRTGVSLFFVLSGFLITRILIATKESPNYFSSFFARRSLRIFPLYYLFLLINYIILPLIGGAPITPFHLQIYHWTYMQGFAQTFNWKHDGPIHFWSLAVEEHFYLFWPLLIYFLNKKRIVFVSILIIIMAFIVRLILVKNHYEPYHFTFARIDELAIGSLFAILEIKNKLNNQNASRFLLISAICSIPTIILWVFFTGTGNPFVQVIKYDLLAFTYFGIIGFIISAKETNWVKRFLRLNPLLFSGKISYGLYVYHPLCILAVNRLMPSTHWALNFILALGFTFLVATTSYYLFEIRFLKLKRFFGYKKDNELKTEAAIALPVGVQNKVN